MLVSLQLRRGGLRCLRACLHRDLAQLQCLPSWICWLAVRSGAPANANPRANARASADLREPLQRHRVGNARSVPMCVSRVTRWRAVRVLLGNAHQLADVYSGALQCSQSELLQWRCGS